MWTQLLDIYISIYIRLWCSRTIPPSLHPSLLQVWWSSWWSDWKHASSLISDSRRLCSGNERSHLHISLLPHIIKLHSSYCSLSTMDQTVYGCKAATSESLTGALFELLHYFECWWWSWDILQLPPDLIGHLLPPGGHRAAVHAAKR